MRIKINFLPTTLLLLVLMITNCKDGNSVFDPDYESPNDSPVISGITPANGYLAGVDSVIVNGQGFSDDPDELTINFGGSPGVIRSASETQLVVKPGVISGASLPVLVSKRGAEFFSDPFNYQLFDPFNFYPGTDANDAPNTPVAVDANDNVYTVINRNGVIRYTRISTDGTLTTDEVKYPGEPRPDLEDSSPYPTDSTMRYSSYSDLEIGPGGTIFITQQSVRAIFNKTFGDGLRETVWGASSTGALKINDIVFDNNGFLWVVGRDSDQIHRFNVSNKSETKFSFPGVLNSVAFFAPNNELFVGGSIGGSQKVWKFTIDGSGNIGAGSLYFDFGQYYEGNIRRMILASNGELLIATGSPNTQVDAEEGIVRVFPNGNHQPFYEGMIKADAFGITWRSDKYAVVVNNGDDASINFMDMFDRERAGIFGFN
jgi:hypothetical protein